MISRSGWGFKAFTLLVLVFVTGLAFAQEKIDPPTGPTEVSEPVVPTITKAVRDLPDFVPDPNLFGLEAKRRETFGIIPIEYPIEPRVDPLMKLQELGGPRLPDSFGTPVHNYAGQSSTVSPPDTNGDVGLTYFVQGTNQSVSSIQVLNKSTGAVAKTFTLQSLATSSPCNSGFCDVVVNYDRAADRWLLTELPASGGNVCVYVSTTGDPTGTYYYYTFAVESSLPDYPKYGVWPQNGNGGSYVMGANAGSSGKDLFAFDRAKMLAGQAATFQKFTVASLPNFSFQLVLPGGMQGQTPPPNGEPAIFVRPRDDEAQDGASTPTYDLLEMWALSVDWNTPANSTLTQLTSLHMGDYDASLCGLGSDWSCMPQPGTTQALDPIREPLHHPFVYRNFGDHQALVGTFVEDVDGTDHSALRWFELRKPVGSGSWSLYQEGVVGGEAGVHRSVGSITIDQSSNIAMVYTRTGSSAPYYPSIYYRGRLSTDTLGTMPQGEYVIQDGAYSKTGNERWGDYAGAGIDPSDDCTFWFTTEYMLSNSNCGTRVAAAKFDACGCLSIPPAPTASAMVPQDNRISISWNDSSTASITRYYVLRSTTSGGPYEQIAEVADTSPGVGGGAGYTYNDDTVSGGLHYYYVVKSNDGLACTSSSSNEVDAVATGACLLAPTFAGITGASNPGESTCTLNLSWSAGASVCGNGLRYNVYRDTTSGFTPSPANRIATNVTQTTYADAVGIARGTVYYYVVRAVDAGNGAEESNTVKKSGSPTGPIVTSSWTDTFESTGGFDQAGWTHAPGTGTTDWTWATAYYHDGTHSWFAQDVSSVSDMTLTSPAFGVGASTTMNFWHTYAFESTTTCYDGGTLEWSADGTTWTAVPAADFTAGAYTGTIYASSNPIYNKPAWCGGTIGALTQVSINLGADAALLGKTIQLRWHEGSDGSVAVTGWYVDTVAVSNAQIGGVCEVGTGCVTPPEAPFASATAPQLHRIAVGWNDSAMASVASYKVYRSTTNGGPYTQIATVGDTSPGVGGGPGYTYNDDTVSGGSHYYYVVRSTDGIACTSVNSNQADAVATGNCLLSPTFAGATGVSNASATTCTLNVAWSAGTSNCSTALQYNVYRGTTAGFTPSSANRIATGLTGTSYADAVGIADRTTYYYIVRAVDTASGSEESNLTVKSAFPTGTGNLTSWTDTFEGSLSGGGFDLADWSHSAISGTTNWAWSTAYHHDGTHSWYAADVSGPDDMVLTSPSFSVGATTTMSFWHTYAFEGSTSTCFDAGTLEYSTDGTTWTVVPATDFTAGGYTGTASSSYSNPLGGEPAWCGGTIGTMTQVTINLGSDANLVNRTIRLRWHEGNDSSVSSNGWYVDTVNVTNAGNAGTCTTGTCSAPGSATGLLYLTPASGIGWTAATGATGYDLVRGTLSTLTAGGFTSSTNACLANDAGATTFVDSHIPNVGDADWYLVRYANACGVGTFDEGSASQAGPRDAAIAASANACP
jgi:hypothetical protein